MKSYRISPRELLSAFSTAENRLCRTLVRRRDDFRRFCIFFISRRAGAKLVRTKNAKIIVVSIVYVSDRKNIEFLYLMLQLLMCSRFPHSAKTSPRFSGRNHKKAVESDRYAVRFGGFRASDCSPAPCSRPRRQWSRYAGTA